MSQISDKVGAPGGNVPMAPTPQDEPQATGEAAFQPTLTEAQGIWRHKQAEEEFRARQAAFMADFNKNLVDPPGYGSNENEFSKGLKGAMSANGLPVPTAQQAQTVNAAVSQTPAFNDAVGQMKGVLNGESPVPAPKDMKQMLDGVLAQAPSLATVGTSGAANGTPAAAAANGAPAAATANGTPAAATANGAAPATQNLAANGTAPNGTATGTDWLSNTLANSNNYTALVMLVTLEAQKQNNKEKNDVLRQIKMFNGMLDQLNTMINNNLIAAQKQIEDKKNAGKDKKGFKAEDIQVVVNWPTALDTKNASMNADTGEVVLNAEWGNSSGSSRQLVGASGLTNLIQTADQWRQSIQNNQQQQSNRFQAKDNLSSSLWNILNAVLKNTHDGVSGTTRNI